jgi:hypothetical protein
MTDRYVLMKNGEVVFDTGVTPTEVSDVHIRYGTVVNSMAAASLYGQTPPDNLGPDPHYWIQEKQWITAAEAEKFRAVTKTIEVPQGGIDDGRRVLPSDGSYLTFGASAVGEERTYNFTCERNTQMVAWGSMNGGVGSYQGVYLSIPGVISTPAMPAGTVGYGLFIPGQNYSVTVKMVNGGAVSLQVQG